jgi:hypothetical protein
MSRPAPIELLNLIELGPLSLTASLPANRQETPIEHAWKAS